MLRKKLTILLHRYEHATKIESLSFEKNRFKTHANKQQINQTENFHAKKKTAHTNHTNKNHLFQNLIDLHYGVPHAKSSKLVSFQFQNIPHTTSTTHMNMCTTHKNAVKTPFKKKL